MANLMKVLVPMIEVLVLVIVVVIDFFFRRDVYHRSDPFSFSLLFYSFALILTDTYLKIIGLVIGQPVDPRLIIAPAVYLVIAFVIFQLTKNAHINFRIAQEYKVRGYLESVRATTPAVDPAIWLALEALGKEMIEPDVFRKSASKLDRRMEYLQLVRELTGANIDPENDQEKLLVRDQSATRFARIAHASTVFFAIASALFFFYWK